MPNRPRPDGAPRALANRQAVARRAPPLTAQQIQAAQQQQEVQKVQAAQAKVADRQARADAKGTTTIPVYGTVS